MILILILGIFVPRLNLWVQSQDILHAQNKQNRARTARASSSSSSCGLHSQVVKARPAGAPPLKCVELNCHRTAAEYQNEKSTTNTDNLPITAVPMTLPASRHRTPSAEVSLTGSETPKSTIKCLWHRFSSKDVQVKLTLSANWERPHAVHSANQRCLDQGKTRHRDCTPSIIPSPTSTLSKPASDTSSLASISGSEQASPSSSSKSKKGWKSLSTIVAPPKGQRSVIAAASDKPFQVRGRGYRGQCHTNGIGRNILPYYLSALRRRSAGDPLTRTTRNATSNFRVGSDLVSQQQESIADLARELKAAPSVKVHLDNALGTARHSFVSVNPWPRGTQMEGKDKLILSLVDTSAELTVMKETLKQGETGRGTLSA
ncbi:hypothetical protein DFP72DRAFT_1048778 [Ephemerocybe angulata]|uniref:Uncharacterized protein n=1 Tax=Ephemerocybe angulata TaxID=980116 RepID=A0A8H6M1F9_9AGAR|nr:hypothetical protein DFP72DRAFT_1048778 [Tulosesus angulatus]